MSNSPRSAGAGPADHAAMRRANRGLIVDHLRRAGVSSRSDIAIETGLAPPTVSMIIGDLLRENLVTEVGTQSGSGAGRPRVLLRYNARSSYLLGVHVGVLRTTVVVGDALGAPVSTSSMPTPQGRPATALRRISTLALESLENAGAAKGLLTTAGFSLPGLIDNDGMLLLAPNLGWRNVPVTNALSQHLGVPVVAANVTNASLLAEAEEGVGRDTGDIVLVYAGTGVGAATLARGELLVGARGIAGEFGHVRAVAGGDPCSCGKSGCLETLVSTDAVARTATQRWRRSGVVVAPVDADAGLSSMDVALAAGRGDTTAIEVLGEAGERLGAAAAWLVNLYNPACLILAGGLAGAGTPLFDPFRRAVERDAMPEAFAGLRIETSALGQEAEVRGAMLLAERAAQRATSPRSALHNLH